MNEEKGMHGNEPNPSKRTETKARGNGSLKGRKTGRWGGRKEEKDLEVERRVTGGIKGYEGRQANECRKEEK